MVSLVVTEPPELTKRRQVLTGWVGCCAGEVGRGCRLHAWIGGCRAVSLVLGTKPDPRPGKVVAFQEQGPGTRGSGQRQARGAGLRE